MKFVILSVAKDLVRKNLLSLIGTRSFATLRMTNFEFPALFLFFKLILKLQINFICVHPWFHPVLDL